MRRLRVTLVVAVGAVWTLSGRPLTGQAPTPQRLVASESSLIAGGSDASALAALRAADQQVTSSVAAGDLRARSRDADTLMAGRTHERLAQFHRGVPVFGADVTRQINAFGQTVSIFGTYYPDITIDTTPSVTSDQARALLALTGGPASTLRGDPGLVVLPVQGGYRLTWSAAVNASVDGYTHRTFIDAVTGDLVFSYNDTWTQGVVGAGTGLMGDALKISASPSSTGSFQAVDLLRPGTDTTYDMRGDVNRSRSIANGQIAVASTDIATSQNNTWSGAVASAQAYAGLTMDYYRLRFNRAGIDNHNLKVRCFVNTARPQDALTIGSSANFRLFYNNAFYQGNGFAFFGVGSLTASGAVNYRNFAGGIDVVSHELSHGVTEFTSNLIYEFESGALNESFSDMMSAAVEFMFQPLGTGPAKADWLEGEDVAPTTVAALRSFSNPHSLNAPDHYSLKLITTIDNDDGGVHTNSNIVNHMYFLAIMGGTNRVSGITVTGVGFDHRDQIERVVYRAFTQLLPANATFSVARAATIQAARDLFGAGSPTETAITQAWNAVGVS